MYWARRGIAGAEAAVSATQHGWWRVVTSGGVLAFALVLLIPPHGILSGNEENYFALAERFVSGTAWPQETAVFDASPHRALSDATLGTLVSLAGYAPTQVVTRLLAAAAYGLVLTRLFRAFGLSALDVALVVMTMALIGQDIVGGEWLFGGYEAKVAAYVLALAGLRSALVPKRLATATRLFVAATYFHFLVGGFWFVAALALVLLSAPRELRRVAEAAALFVLSVAPLAGVIAWSRFTDTSAALATDVPPPDVIYSIVREPHHQSPFLSWGYFRDYWLPGYLMAAAMLAASVWAAWRGPTRQLRVVALWLAGLLFYLLVVLAPKYLDRDTGVLGKFYLFRPSSLVLLLWLTLVLACATGLLTRWAWLLRTVLLTIVGPAFLYTQGMRVAGDVAGDAALEREKQPLAAAIVRTAGPRDVVLIDPELEARLLDFERRTGRPTFVMWKFAPTNDSEIIGWYRRMMLRQSIFDQGCDAGQHTVEFAFLLTTPAKASRLGGNCGAEAHRAAQWVLLGRNPRTAAGEP